MTTSLQPGEVFDGRFRIDSRLGRGAFATVWLATDRESRQVALKILAPDRGDTYDARTRARFEREVRALAGLRDRHTVTLLTYGESEGLLFLVFEVVQGRDLVEVLAQRGRLMPGEVIHIVRQVLSSLREAHGAGLIHRDIKPQNIRVFENDGDPLQVKLLDFGIARPTDDGGPSLTRTGEIVGTPRYMSPEQLTGKPLTPASDIYTLGVVAFELLAGMEALPGSTVGDQLGRLRAGHLFSAPELEHAGALMDIIQKMTSHDAASRYPSAAAVLSALDHPPRPSLAPATSPSSQAEQAQSRTADARWLVPIVAAVVALLMVGAFVLWGGREEPEPVVIPSAIRDPGTLVKQPPALVENAAAPVDAGQNVESAPDASAAIGARDGAVPSLGCGALLAHSGLGTFAERSLRFLPLRYDGKTPLPLVVMLHSDYQEPEYFMHSSGFTTLADRDHVILLALADGNQFGGHVWRDGDADVHKVVSLVTRALGELCVDRARIMLLGHGDGGRVALPVSCRPSVAALAINSFSVPRGGALCDRPVPALWLHPMKSVHMPSDGSKNCSGNYKQTPDDMEAMWRARNGCEAKAATTVEYGTSTCRRWTCDAPFEMCRLDGGSPWPGTESPALKQIMGCRADQAPEFPVAARIWEFFMTAPPLDEVPETF